MTYVAIHEVDSWREMPSNEFAEIGRGDGDREFPLVHVVGVPDRGYAILGPSGAYVSDGTRVIDNLNDVYEALESLGVKLITVHGRIERLDEEGT